MHLIKTATLCAALTLTACSGSNNPEPLFNATDGASTTDPAVVSTDGGTTNNPAVNNVEPTDNGAGTGSITISTEPTPMLAPLPEVTFTPAANNTDSESDSTGTSSEVMASSPASGDGGGGTVGATAGTTATSGATAGASSVTGGTTGGTTGGSGIEVTSTTAADAGTSVGTDGAGLDTGHVVDPTTPVVVIDPPIEPRPDFQAGSLTAADYDDQLNPHLYQDYASEYLQRAGGRLDVPYLDLSKRIGLHVTDEQGRHYGGARIDISDANGQVLSLQVPASGITYIYSNIDELPEQFTIRATGKLGTAVEKMVDLAQLGSGPGRIDIVIPENAAPANVTQQATGLDIMFVIDTTGSMGDELNYLQTELSSIINALPTHVQPNLGLTFYRDIGDEYVVRAHGFNNDINSVQRTLNNETYGGGGDYPEAMDQALHQAIDANWQQDSHKVLFLIADAPPHNEKMRATWEAAEQARAKDIHIVPVAASGVEEDAEYLMRSIAAFTNSRYVFLTDDSGYGNSHAEPDVDCYAVTQLNNLMIRVLNSLISGVRQEPTDNEIIRTVGNYNEGVCDPVFTILPVIPNQ